MPMLYMVSERYLSGPGPVYERAASHGRMLPGGLRYLGSWVVDDGRWDRCFQLMETDDPALIDVWRQRGSAGIFPALGSFRRRQTFARTALVAGRRGAGRRS